MSPAVWFLLVSLATPQSASPSKAPKSAGTTERKRDDKALLKMLDATITVGETSAEPPSMLVPSDDMSAALAEAAKRCEASLRPAATAPHEIVLRGESKGCGLVDAAKRAEESLAACLQPALVRNPDLRGSLTVKVKAASAVAIDRQGIDKVLEKCALAALKAAFSNETTGEQLTLFFHVPNAGTVDHK